MLITWKCKGNASIDINKCMEALRKSGFDTTLDFSFKSFSGSTVSSAEIIAGTSTCTPFKSKRNKSAEFKIMLDNVSPHSRDCKKNKYRYFCRYQICKNLRITYYFINFKTMIHCLIKSS